MTATERFYKQVDEAADEIADIRARGSHLYDQIAILVMNFSEDHGISPHGALEELDQLVENLKWQACEDADERKDEANNAIEAAEFDDLMLSRVP